MPDLATCTLFCSCITFYLIWQINGWFVVVVVVVVVEGTTHCMLRSTESYYSHGNVCLRVLHTVCYITLSHIIVMVMFV